MRWGSVTPVVSLALWLILTPMMTTIWHYPEATYQGEPFWIWSSEPLMVRTLGRWLFELGVPLSDDAYFRYSRYFFLVYLLLIPAVLAFHNRHVSLGLKSKGLARISFLILTVSLAVACLADFTSYALGVFSEFLWSGGFMIEVFALVGVVVGSVLYGITIVRHGVMPRWAGWVVIASGVLVVAMSVESWVVDYWPNDQVLPLCLAWSVLGVFLVRGRSQRVEA